MSANEQQLLIARYGTVHAGLRAALDQLLAQQAPAKKRKKSAPEAAVDAASAPAGTVLTAERPAGVTPCRIHRNYKVVRRWAESGVDWTTRRCQDCGFEVSRPDHG